MKGDRVAVVTGGSRGIGREIVRLLHRRGYAVLFTHSDSEGDAKTLELELTDGGPTCGSLQIDVSSREAPPMIFDTAEKLGTVVALVNNAGITGPLGKLADLEDSNLRKILAVNLEAPILLSRESARRWSGREFRSSIVNITSIAARTGSPDEYVAYAATKGALETFTVGLARELASDAIHVNAVSPGTIDTTIHARAGEPERAQRIAQKVPLKRPGQASEIANAVAWLLSDEASYVTGAILPVTGGL